MKNNLTTTYIEFTTLQPGYEKVDCARDLAESFDRAYDVNKLNKWARGGESLPKNVRDHMLRTVLGYAIEKAGGHLDDDIIDDVCDRII